MTRYILFIFFVLNINHANAVYEGTDDYDPENLNVLFCGSVLQSSNHISEQLYLPLHFNKQELEQLFAAGVYRNDLNQSFAISTYASPDSKSLTPLGVCGFLSEINYQDARLLSFKESVGYANAQVKQLNDDMAAEDFNASLENQLQEEEALSSGQIRMRSGFDFTRTQPKVNVKEASNLHINFRVY